MKRRALYSLLALGLSSTNLLSSQEDSGPIPQAAGTESSRQPLPVDEQPSVVREDFKELPPEIPIGQHHIANPRLILHRLGPGADLIKKSFHENIPNDPHYVWSGLCEGRWALAFELRDHSLNLSTGATLRWRTKQSADRILYLVLQTPNGWLIADQGTPKTEDWSIDQFAIQSLDWRALDTENMTQGAPEPMPDLDHILAFGFTDLKPGGQSAACSRVDWIELTFPAPSPKPAQSSD